MATTVTTSDLTVSITESYTLNGVEYGGTTSKVFSNNGEVIKRVMRVGTASFDSVFDYETEGLQADYKYMRITNMDDTNFISLQFFNTNLDAFWVKLKAGESFLLMDNEYEINEGAATFGAFYDLSRISAKSDTLGCDLEFLSIVM
tara:strand:+ start:6822 stop:7259 length:438 start_codon:yes stop_codon:yes gene_type:complete